MAIRVTSSAFEDNSPIPKKHAYKGEGENTSPPISWSGAPDGTKEIALICDDPDAPRDEPWVHWVLANIPGDFRGIPEGSDGGSTPGKNDFGEQGWGGPMPPKGHGVHHYHFKVYALDAELEVEPGVTKARLLEAMKGHVLAQGELIGTYER